jgi:hypothetical protein
MADRGCDGFKEMKGGRRGRNIYIFSKALPAHSGLQVS